MSSPWGSKPPTGMPKKSSDPEEDAPPMRAVALMNQAPSLAHVAPVGVKSFGGLSGPPAFGTPVPSPYQRSGSKTSSPELFGVQEEWDGVSVPSTWNVKGEDLDMLPWEFPLERTNREIHCSASVVAERISDILRCMSVQAEFCSQQARAKCKTTDCVSFRIRLYAGGEGGEPVIVEVQRRSGSAASFMRTCRAVLDAAEGKKVEPIAKKSPFESKPVDSLKCLAPELTKQSNPEQDASEALNEVSDMLRSEKRDTNILGLENLCSLTNPTKTNASVSLSVSKLVALGQDRFDMREELRVLTDRDAFAGEFEGHRMQTAHKDHLRHLALSCLSNAIGMCSRDGCLAPALKTQSSWFVENLLPSLVEELKLADTSANNAYQAACCIFSLLDCADCVQKHLADEGGVRLLEMANKVGKARHELLAIETKRCLNLLR